ncbi:helix-turn-helix domain-containing protein [Sinomicrobium sp. M5D2P9]
MKNIQIRNIKERNLSGSFTMSNLSVLLAESDMVEKIHRHNFFFILAIKIGDGEHQIDFTSYPVNDCSVFILRPGQVHKLLLKKGSKGYLMGFDSSFYSPKEQQKRKVFREASFNNFYSFDIEDFNRLIPVLECIFQEYSNREIMYKENIKANLDLFFIELFRQSKRNNILPHNNLHTQELFEELMEMLEIHICDHKQVTYYAENLKLTSYQLNTITKKTSGKNCSQLINEYIILEAKRHLMATSNQVKEIAYHLGYEDTSYFIRFFKKQTGLTPEAFRQNFK